MKKRLFSALALTLLLLSACGPKGDGSSQSTPNVPTRPPAAGEQLPDSTSSSDQPAPEVPQPDLEVLTKWRSDYRYDAQYLRQSMAQLSKSFDMISCTRWPDGRELVDVGDLEPRPLLFSGPLDQEGSVCAAVALDLYQPTTPEELREEWGESLTFHADDPVAGPSWTVTDGSLTYHFRTDSTGQELLPQGQGGNLVLSMDELLPESPSDNWIASAGTWVDLWEIQPEGPLADLLPYAQTLGTSSAPSGATEPADSEYLDFFYSQYGVKDPATGVQYMSYEGGENTLWDGVIVPVSLVFGGSLPQNPDALMSAVNVPFRWSVYNMVGYWFYLDQYTVYLSSDYDGAVPGNGYFLIRLGDNVS